MLDFRSPWAYPTDNSSNKSRSYTVNPNTLLTAVCPAWSGLFFISRRISLDTTSYLEWRMCRPRRFKLSTIALVSIEQDTVEIIGMHRNSSHLHTFEWREGRRKSTHRAPFPIPAPSAMVSHSRLRGFSFQTFVCTSAPSGCFCTS